MKRFSLILGSNSSIFYLRKYLLLISFLFIISIWFCSLLYYDLPVTFKNIVFIHKNYFYLILIDFLFFVIFLYDKLVLDVIKKNQFTESKLNQREIEIEFFTEWIYNIINGSDTNKFRNLDSDNKLAEMLYILESKIHSEVENR